MKKLMVVAMVAFAAVAANAAKATWGVNDGTVAGINAGTMFLVWADTAPNFSALADMESFSEATIAAIGGKVLGSTTYAGGVNTPEALIKPGVPEGSGMTAGPHSFYTMLVKDDGKAFAYSAVSQATILANENTASFAKAGSTYTVVPAKDPGPIPPVVPEPTSGLLLLLGVAGLALRRRQA